LDRHLCAVFNQRGAGKPLDRQTRIVYADLEGTSDPHGLWLTNVKTTHIKASGEELIMARFMILWAFIVALGVIDQAQLELGFAGGVQLEPSADLTDQSTHPVEE
jgi:hypothetical protein